MTGHAVTQADIDAFWWFHSIDFGNGLASKGAKHSASLDLEISSYFDGLDLSGRSVIDIGAWNGAVSFAAKSRGAGRVLAADKYAWTNSVFRGRETFELARSLLGQDIEAAEIDVPELSLETVGHFDVVMFLGVFYHLFDAPSLLKRVAGLATDLLILETHQDALDFGRPAMVYYPGGVLNNDESNFWGPNPECTYEMLCELGFERIFYQDSPHCTDENTPTFRIRGIVHAFRSSKSLSRYLADGALTKGWLDLSDTSVRAEVFKPIGGPQAQLAAERQRREAAEASISELLSSASLRAAIKLLGGRRTLERLMANVSRVE